MGRGCSKTLARRANTPSRDFSAPLSSLNQRLRIMAGVGGLGVGRLGGWALGSALGLRVSGMCRMANTRHPGPDIAIRDSVRFDREDLRDSVGVHAHTVQGVGAVHGRPVVGDDDK